MPRKKKRYFGTDGIRGRVGDPPITAEFVLKLGWAAGCVLAARRGHGTVLIGKDTRISGYMLESALEAGLSAAGVDIRLLGPMPTPAIAYLTQTLHAQAGIVISASHNPYQDNGIKFFSSDGTKLGDEVEYAIEAQLHSPMTTVSSHELGKAVRLEDAPGRYIEFCKSTIPYGTSFQGLSIVVDCAHGATYHVAPCVFEELGARVHGIGVEPNGLNINDGCGTTDPRMLQAAVRKHRADVGVAFDGDGDRVIMVDHRGEVVDGDELLFIMAEAKRAEHQLNGAVVGTVMSNLGLEEALRERGIELKRARVGDRYVLELMLTGGCTLGGETSGHIICLDRMTTGDGIVSALQVLAAAGRTGKSLHELKRGMNKYPQSIVNVPMERRVDVMRLRAVQQAVRAVESELAEDGRVLLRPSGTEPLVRVMVEGRERGQVETLARQLAGAVEKAVAEAAR
jgi:phosphoglucosamine mutase